MNTKVSLFVGALLLIPSISGAGEAYTIQCDDALSNIECTVTSSKKIRSVRVEMFSGRNGSVDVFDKKFENCPTEVSVTLGFVVPGEKFFIETCDGSNAIEAITQASPLGREAEFRTAANQASPGKAGEKLH